MELSSRARAIETSVTLALDARAKDRAAAGKDVINMSVGEPDFAAPALAQEAAARIARSNSVRYTPAAGSLELRREIGRHLEATRGVRYGPDEIIVCHSCKHALSGAVLALVGPGDEVLLPRPAWVSYDEQVRIAGGVPVGVRPRTDSGPDFAAFEAAITPRSVGVMLNTPCNPSGYVWTKSEVAQLARIANEHDLWILSDEIYRRLVYEGEPNPTPVAVDAATRARTLILDGASKAFAMTGYRIGFAAGPAPIIKGIVGLHSHLTGCPNAISQAAYLAALRGDPPEVAGWVAEFDERRRFLVAALRGLGLETPWPRGAFYAFPNVAPWLDARGSAGFCTDLLEEQDVALVPGSAFGQDDHVRFSYALPLTRIETAVERLKTFLAQRRKRRLEPQTERVEGR